VGLGGRHGEERRQAGCSLKKRSRKAEIRVRREKKRKENVVGPASLGYGRIGDFDEADFFCQFK
jgi:hypothetical protein